MLGLIGAVSGFMCAAGGYKAANQLFEIPGGALEALEERPSREFAERLEHRVLDKNFGKVSL